MPDPDQQDTGDVAWVPEDQRLGFDPAGDPEHTALGSDGDDDTAALDDLPEDELVDAEDLQ